MDEIESKSPYRTLGKQLKALRTRVNESLAEASGAVEIDVRELASYELGKSRPTEDVLLLLISHFGAKDDEAVKLWETAGYGADKIPASRMTNKGAHTEGKSEEARVVYTDVVDIMVNNYGVVMNFMQAGPGNSANSVSKVGMSREHAKSVLKILQMTLTQTESNQTDSIKPAENKN